MSLFLFLTVIQGIIAAALVGIILMQKSEGGGLGMGGGGGGMGGFLTARGAANLLTRTTAILAGLFICTSLVLALMASHNRRAAPPAIGDPPSRSAPSTLGSPSAPGTPATPDKPASPSTPPKN